MKQSYFRLAAILLLFNASGCLFATLTPTGKEAPRLISGEYCEWEDFEATCDIGFVVMVKSAHYGRMKVGRCITNEFGQTGCYVDVTNKVADVCTGRRTCLLRVTYLNDMGRCPKDFKSYLEVHHECIKVVTSTTGCPLRPSSSSSSSAHNHDRHRTMAGKYVASFTVSDRNPETADSISEVFRGHYVDGVTSGFLSSSVAMETGDGTVRCPWIFRLHPLHQKLHLTFHRFSNHDFISNVRLTETRMTSMSYHGNDHNDDVDSRRNIIIVNVTSGQNSDFVSGKYAIEIEVVFMNLTTTLNDTTAAVQEAFRSHRHHLLRRHEQEIYGPSLSEDRRHAQRGSLEPMAILIEFKVTGCMPLNAPPNTWSTTDGHVTNVTCNDTDEFFHLTCAGNEWSGRIGNCSEGQSRRRSNIMDYWNYDGFVQQGLLFVVMLGVLIGIATGFLMLIAVMAYMKKRKQRRIRSHSSYALNVTQRRDVMADLSLFDLYEPQAIAPLNQIHQHYDPNHHQQHHNHHHQDFIFPEDEEDEEDEEEESRTGSLLKSDGHVVSGEVLTSHADEVNRRNWIWSTWARKAEVNNGLNSGKYDGWHLRIGDGKAASTMTMMVRKMTGKMKKNPQDIFSHHYGATQAEVPTTATDASTTDTSDNVESIEHELNCSREFEQENELNTKNDFNVESEEKSIEELRLKQSSSKIVSKCGNDSHFFKLKTNVDLIGTKHRFELPTTPCVPRVWSSPDARLFHNSTSNCNSADISHQNSLQHKPQQQVIQQSINNVEQQIPSVANSLNIGAPQVQQFGNFSCRDGLYGVCFGSDSPYNFAIDALNGTRRQQFQPLQPLQRQQPLQPLQRHLQQLQENIIQQHRTQQTPPHNSCSRRNAPHHQVGVCRIDHLHRRLKKNNNDGNDDGGGDDDDEDDGDDANESQHEVTTNHNSKDELNNTAQLSPGKNHHHHNFNLNHHHPSCHNNNKRQLQNACADDRHHRRHHHQFSRPGQLHYNHPLYHHHHHHNFLKPDLVTQTPPPLPVKCFKANRCPLCSINNLSVTTASSAIL